MKFSTMLLCAFFTAAHASAELDTSLQIKLRGEPVPIAAEGIVTSDANGLVVREHLGSGTVERHIPAAAIERIYFSTTPHCEHATDPWSAGRHQRAFERWLRIWSHWQSAAEWTDPRWRETWLELLERSDPETAPIAAIVLAERLQDWLAAEARLDERRLKFLAQALLAIDQWEAAISHLVAFEAQRFPHPPEWVFRWKQQALLELGRKDEALASWLDLCVIAGHCGEEPPFSDFEAWHAEPQRSDWNPPTPFVP